MTDPKLRISAVDETRAAFTSVAGNLDHLKTSALSLKAGIAGLATSIAGLAVVENFRTAIDAADHLDELSQKVGVSAETISELGLAIKLGGTDLESFSGGLKKLSVNMVEAQRGAGDAADAFKALGVNVESGPGSLKSVDEVLLEIADKFDKTADGANKTALAVAIFGRAGADLVPFLNQGRDGIEGLRKEAQRLGLVVSSDTARAAGQLKDNLDVLAESAKRTTNQLVEALLPGLVKITEQMRLGAQQGGFFAGILAGMREAVIQTFGTSTTQELEQVTAGLAAASKRAAELDQEMTKPRRRGTLGLLLPQKEELARVNAEIEQLKRRSIELQTLQQFETPGGLNASVKTPTKPQAPALPKKGEKVSDDFESTLKGLQQQIEATEALTEFEKILAGIESGRLKLSADPAIAAAQREQLERAAAQLDVVKEDKALREEVARVIEENAKAQAEATRREAEALNASRDRYLELIDPVKKYREQLEEVRTLLGKGLLTDEQAAKAFDAIGKQIESMNEDLKDSKAFARDLGLTFTSAFEEAISSGSSFRDILKGIASDLVKLGTRKFITEPVGKWLDGAISSGGGLAGLLGGGNSASSVGYQNSFDNPSTGGGGGSAMGWLGLVKGIGSLFGFAEGGSFTVGGGGGIDSQVVAFRATPGERVAITPPGRGGGSSVNVIINMPQTVTRDTIQQAAARFGEAALLATRRNR